jgi:alginate O-acetyltransferase complex protein AlgI
MKFGVAELLASGLAPGEGIAAGFDQIKAGWGALDVWLLAFGFGFQLFFDFAGYSHIVIGIARMFGIRLQENFDRPYLAPTPAVFWTRWHMSLSFWIRDYVFFPLAALRRERWWLYVVLIAAMSLFGLWHAAKATFIVWGIYHGLLLVVHRLGQQLKVRVPFGVGTASGGLLAGAATFAMVSLGWILFRANDLAQALLMLRLLFSADSYGHSALPPSLYIVTSAVMIGYFVYEAMAALLNRWREAYSGQPDLPRGSAAAVELEQLLRERVWWWLAPISFVALMVAGIMIFQENTPPKAFMYTRF